MQKSSISLEKSRCSVEITVPFKTERLARIAYNAIDSDEIPNPTVISRTIDLSKDKLTCLIESEDLSKLRTSLNNYIEAVIQVQKTQDRFDS